MTSAFNKLKPTEQKKLIKFFMEEFEVAEESDAIEQLRACRKADLALHLDAALNGYI